MFIIGHTYENRNGGYVVLAIHGNILDVKYEDGTSTKLDALYQKRIIDKINAVHNMPTGTNGHTYPKNNASINLVID